MGNTTKGDRTKTHPVRWADMYRRYAAVHDKPEPKPFKLNELNQEIKEQNVQLNIDLKFISDYYNEIGVYQLLAHSYTYERDTQKQADLKQQLNQMEDSLCGSDRLHSYFHAQLGAMRALSDIAKQIDGYLQSINRVGNSSSSADPSDAQMQVLAELLREVKAIAQDARSDFVAEVGTTPVGAVAIWQSYIDDRRKSLRAAVRLPS